MAQPTMAVVSFASCEYTGVTPAHPFSPDADFCFHRPPVPVEARKPKLLDQVRAAIRVRHRRVPVRGRTPSTRRREVCASV